MAGPRGARRRRAVAVVVLSVAALTAFVATNLPKPDDREGEDLETAAEQAPAGQQFDQQYPPVKPALAAQADSALTVRGAPDLRASLYDLRTGASLWEGTLPFDKPVTYPDVVATDDGNYVVTAVPCATARWVDDAVPECSPGGVAVARFDASARRFQSLTATGLDGRTPYIHVLGAVGSNLIVQADGQLYSLPSAGGKLAPLPAAPLEGFVLACLRGDQVVVVRPSGPGSTMPEPGELVEGDAQPFVPFEAAVLDITAQRWTSLGGPDATYDTTDTFVLGCLDRGVAAVPSAPPASNKSPYATHVLDVASGVWLEMEPPPREFLSAAPAVSKGNELVVAVSTDPYGKETAVLTLNGQTGEWSETLGGPGANATAVALADDHLVAMSDSSATLDVARIGT